MIDKESSKIIFNENMLLHGINFDEEKFLSIIKNGILNKEAAKKRNLQLAGGFSRGVAKEIISLCDPLAEMDEDNGVYHSCYVAFIKSNLSLIIDKSKLTETPKKNPEERYYDELLINGNVVPSAISGVMIPLCKTQLYDFVKLNVPQQWIIGYEPTAIQKQREL